MQLYLVVLDQKLKIMFIHVNLRLGYVDSGTRQNDVLNMISKCDGSEVSYDVMLITNPSSVVGLHTSHESGTRRSMKWLCTIKSRYRTRVAASPATERMAP